MFMEGEKVFLNLWGSQLVKGVVIDTVKEGKVAYVKVTATKRLGTQHKHGQIWQVGAGQVIQRSRAIYNDATGSGKYRPAH